MTFAVCCPHCNDANGDPFEVMARGEIDWTLCAGCGKRFYFLVAECNACEEESVFAWKEAPVPPWTPGLCCGHCGQRLEFR